MAFILTSYDDVKTYLKNCSTNRLEKIQQEVWSMILERDEKKFTKQAAKKATSKEHSKHA